MWVELQALQFQKHDFRFTFLGFRFLKVQVYDLKKTLQVAKKQKQSSQV